MDDQDGGWHNNPAVLWAAGLAAVGLLALLVYAVVEMSKGPSATPPQPGEPLPTYVTSTTSPTGSSSTTTSYPVPSVQTSEDSPGAVTTSEPTPNLDSESSAPTSTTIYNPYVTTTNPAAGHV
jgi:hypothetical protein